MNPLTADFDGDTFSYMGSTTALPKRLSVYRSRLLKEYFATEGIKRKAKYRAKLRKYLARTH